MCIQSWDHPCSWPISKVKSIGLKISWRVTLSIPGGLNSTGSLACMYAFLEIEHFSPILYSVRIDDTWKSRHHLQNLRTKHSAIAYPFLLLESHLPYSFLKGTTPVEANPDPTNYHGKKLSLLALCRLELLGTNPSCEERFYHIPTAQGICSNFNGIRCTAPRHGHDRDDGYRVVLDHNRPQKKGDNGRCVWSSAIPPWKNHASLSLHTHKLNRSDKIDSWAETGEIWIADKPEWLPEQLFSSVRWREKRKSWEVSAIDWNWNGDRKITFLSEHV